jgi:multidrug efflux system membrane fusion protein
MPEDRMENKPPAPPIGPDHQLPSGPPQKSKWQRFLVWAVILAVFVIIFVLVLYRHEQAQGGATSSRHAMTGPVTITTATAKKGNIGVYLEAIGTVTPTYTDQITSEVTGMVTKVHYQEGQLVRKGQALIDIDPRPYEAQLLQAQGALERDTYVLEQAKMDLQRYRDAWARNGIPKQTLDDQEKIVLQDEGTVKNDQGTVQYDQVEVGFCHITAPIPGRVGLRLVDPGNVVQASATTTLAVIAEVQPITVVFTVAEDSLPQVQEQMRHGKRLVVDAFDRAQQNKIATGKLLTTDNLIDTTTGTVKLRASFDNKDGSLFPNQFVNTRLLVKMLEGVTLIPTSTIQHNGQTAFVYLIQNDAAQIRNIKPGVVDGGQTAVEGINPGDVVANSSFEKLQNNSKIIVSKQPQPAATSGSSAP